MSERIAVHSVAMVTPPGAEISRGLLGWVRFTFGEFKLDSVAVRRTRNGIVKLVYPARRDRQGRLHPFVLPVDPAVQADIEHQVLEALGFRGGHR